MKKLLRFQKKIRNVLMCWENDIFEHTLPWFKPSDHTLLESVRVCHEQVLDQVIDEIVKDDYYRIIWVR